MPYFSVGLSYSKVMKKHELLNQSQISNEFWEPFLLTGYRQTNTSFLQCLKYIFIVHNDFGNFWTHFIPFWVWLFWLYNSSYKYDFSDPFWHPMLIFWISSCFCAMTSSLAHAFSSKSSSVRHVCFMIDYLAISNQFFACSLASYFYERPLQVSFFQYKQALLFLNVVISLNAICISSMSRFYWQKKRFVLRAVSFLLAYFSSSFPSLVRLLVCAVRGDECLHETIPHHIASQLFGILMIFFFVSKIPERFAPGKFDYFFQSHQLFHISGTGIITMYLFFLQKDAVNRRNTLSSNPYFLPDMYSTFLPYLFNITVGSVIVIILSYMTLKGRLTPVPIATKTT